MVFCSPIANLNNFIKTLISWPQVRDLNPDQVTENDVTSLYFILTTVPPKDLLLKV